MLRFLIGLCLLPFAIFGVLISLVMITKVIKVIDAVTPPHQYPAHAKPAKATR